jgi:protein-L-isoaspartate(D-aspartate) O-methyltransferase
VKDARATMVSDQLRRRGIYDERVLAAFAAVPREAFVAADQQDKAYADYPLPIPHGQTISQPFVVALTASALQVKPTDRVLEVGTGSGYAAAILATLAARVDTIERFEDLANAAALALASYANVEVHHGDGTLGWPVRAPYDAIAVAAAAPEAPPSLLQQLAIGGRLVVPIGNADRQMLTRIERLTETDYKRHIVCPVVFVPLVGREGWPE